MAETMIEAQLHSIVHALHADVQYDVLGAQAVVAALRAVGQTLVRLGNL